MIEANFESGPLSSHVGLMQVPKSTGVSEYQRRSPTLCAVRVTRISSRTRFAQHQRGLVCGYEDLNDRARLRYDSLMKTAVGRDGERGGAGEDKTI